MNIKLLILAMMVVTMLPRMLPFYMFDTERLPKRFKTFLGFVPYTVLGALVLPGSLNALSSDWLPSIVCLAAAWIVGWYRGGIIEPVLASVLTALSMKLTGIL